MYFTHPQECRVFYTLLRVLSKILTIKSARYFNHHQECTVIYSPSTVYCILLPIKSAQYILLTIKCAQYRYFTQHQECTVCFTHNQECTVFFSPSRVHSIFYSPSIVNSILLKGENCRLSKSIIHISCMYIFESSTLKRQIHEIFYFFGSKSFSWSH